MTETPLNLTDPTLTERIVALGRRIPDFSTIPDELRFGAWLQTWYGARDDDAGRSARTLFDVYGADLGPLQAAFLLELRSAPERLKQDFLDLYLRWIDDVNEHQTASASLPGRKDLLA